MQGVIYYNRGSKVLVRLAVSLYTLRQHYTGPVCLIEDADDSMSLTKIAQAFGCQHIKHKFETPRGVGMPYLNKCLLHKATPFTCSLFLDADTIIRGCITPMFAWAAEYDFAIPQFSNWKTSGRVGKRIKRWKGVYPEKMKAALDFGPAINFGVFSWTQDSTLMRDLHSAAVPGRHCTTRYPDEIACQIILPEHKHYVAPQEYNASCRYSNCYAKDVRVIHFHGNKHCRFDESGKHIFHSELWYEQYEAMKKKIKFTDKWICKDSQLRKNSETWNKSR